MLLRTTKGIAISAKKAFCQTLRDCLFPNRMTETEAISILDLKINFTQDDLDSKYLNFYHANSVKNNGSGYLQEIIKNAFEYLKLNKFEKR